MTPVHLLVEVHPAGGGDVRTCRLRLPDDLTVYPGPGDHVPAFWHFGELVPVRGRVVDPDYVVVHLGAWAVDPPEGFRFTRDDGTPIRTWRGWRGSDLMARLAAAGWTTLDPAPRPPKEHHP